MLLWYIHTSLARPPVREPISGSVWPDPAFETPARKRGGREGSTVEAIGEEEWQR